jgi:hypothetical protein
MHFVIINPSKPNFEFGDEGGDEKYSPGQIVRAKTHFPALARKRFLHPRNPPAYSHCIC